MARVATNQIDVLLAVVKRLTDRVALLNDSNCTISDSPDPPPGMTHDLFCTVAPTNGRFDEAAGTGGGEHVAIEYAGVAVTVYWSRSLDQNGQIVTLLTDRTRGLLKLKWQILRALTGHDLEWEGNQILVNLMQPLTADVPQTDRKKIGDLSLTFSTDLEWELDD